MKLKMSLLVLGLVVYACTKEVGKDTQSLYNILFPSANRTATPTATLPGSDKVNIGGKITGLGAGKWVKIKVGSSETTFSEDKNLVYFFLGHPKGAEYKVEVLETSLYLDCSIANATGTPTEDVNNVDVTCDFNPPLTTPTYTVGGTVSGLTGNITLSMTGSVSQTKTISANGSYVFDTTLLETQTYNVTISVHSNTSFCFLVNANASNNMNQTGTVGNANVTDVNIQCVGRLTLNEVLSHHQGNSAPCPTSSGTDYVEVKNISGTTLNLSNWYLCDEGTSSCKTPFDVNTLPTAMLAFPNQNLSNGDYIVFEEQLSSGDPLKLTFGLGSNDTVYLVYRSGGKNYLVELLTWPTGHVKPARKLPDGSYSGFISVDQNQSSWELNQTGTTSGTNKCSKNGVNL